MLGSRRRGGTSYCVEYSVYGTIDTVLHRSLNTEIITSVHYIALYSKQALYIIQFSKVMYLILTLQVLLA